MKCNSCSTKIPFKDVWKWLESASGDLNCRKCNMTFLHGGYRFFLYILWGLAIFIFVEISSHYAQKVGVNFGVFEHTLMAVIFAIIFVPLSIYVALVIANRRGHP